MTEELQLIQEFEINDTAFRNSYQELQKEYANQYVAIKKGKIIDSDKDPKSLINKLEGKKENLIMILIQFVPKKGIQILY